MNGQKPLWIPSAETVANANLTLFMTWLENRGMKFSDYSSLWTWSTEKPDEFWRILLEYFDIQFDGNTEPVRSGSGMPHVTWFNDLKLSYAEHVFRMSSSSSPAILFGSEGQPTREISWSALYDDVAALSSYLRKLGLLSGDRVAAYLPCIPEATVGLLAANSIGAVWASCSPDFGLQAVMDRFVQVEPKVIIASTHYSYGGKRFDKSDVVRRLAGDIPSVECVILVDSDGSVDIVNSVTWESALQDKRSTLEFTRVPFSHPMWIVFSSGTTGLPKAITHGVGGILLEHLKYLTFHNDLHKGERLFWYTTTGWMMWNYLQSALLCGGTMVMYDGSPSYPDLNRLWQFCDEALITHFGTSAGFILACRKESLTPSKRLNFKRLRSIGSTGSTLPPEGFEWIYNHISNGVWLASMSGGTDVATAFVGGNPLWPVYSGEIQCRALGCKLESWDDKAQAVIDQVGEMVITSPMPSMPVFFWNDPQFTRYTESYFNLYPGVWRHGDWIEITSRGGIIIYGRSDATLNRGGVRIGTSEIYRAVDKITEVKDSLIVCIEKEGGDFYMPLFVMMREGQELSDELKKRINSTIRSDHSPRHVPDAIIAVPDIPYTISGKKTETPVKKILMGKNVEEVINAGSLRNPQSLDFFAAFQKKNQS